MIAVSMFSIFRSDGTEIHAGPSRHKPDLFNVAIFGASFDAVQSAVSDLSEQCGFGEFLLPTRGASGRFCTMGRVPSNREAIARVAELRAD